jgi:hypothetical protein
MAEDKDRSEKLERVYRTLQLTLTKQQALNEELFGVRIPTELEGGGVVSFVVPAAASHSR